MSSGSSLGKVSFGMLNGMSFGVPVGTSNGIWLFELPFYNFMSFQSDWKSIRLLEKPESHGSAGAFSNGIPNGIPNGVPNGNYP